MERQFHSRGRVGAVGGMLTSSCPLPLVSLSFIIRKRLVASHVFASRKRLPGAAPPDPTLTRPEGSILIVTTEDQQQRPRRRGGRPRAAPGARRDVTIGVRLAPSELAEVGRRAQAAGQTPATWLREAALSRRLPSPPAPEANREQYAALARLSANFNQLAHQANGGGHVLVDDLLLRSAIVELRRLRMALIGADQERQAEATK